MSLLYYLQRVGEELNTSEGYLKSRERIKATTTARTILKLDLVELLIIKCIQYAFTSLLASI